MLMMALVKMSEVKTQRPLSLGIHPVFQDHLLLNPLVNGIDNTMKNTSDDLRFFDESHVAIIVPYRNPISSITVFINSTLSSIFTLIIISVIYLLAPPGALGVVAV